MEVFDVNVVGFSCSDKIRIGLSFLSKKWSSLRPANVVGLTYPGKNEGH